MESEIGGVNTTVAQIDAQLADAKWKLDQTTIRAPADGAISIMSLSVGDRALRASPVMSIIENDIVIVGMFSLLTAFKQSSGEHRSSSSSTMFRAASTTRR